MGFKSNEKNGIKLGWIDSAASSRLVYQAIIKDK